MDNNPVTNPLLEGEEKGDIFDEDSYDEDMYKKWHKKNQNDFKKWKNDLDLPRIN